MGNCIYTNFTFNKYSNQFLNYNIIDKKHNIIVGTYFDTNESKKSNTMINQGICIGYNNNKISKIKLGIMHCIDNKRIELYFENDIKLIFIVEQKTKIKMLLTFNNNTIEKYIDLNVLNQYKPINNNSEYIDLISNLTNNF